jgi:FkbM family methyltransferase
MMKQLGDEVVETSFGKFLVNPRDGIGSTTKAGTLWDGPGFLQPIAREFGSLGHGRCTILDIGANIGTYSVWLSRNFAWRVIAVEPVPTTMRYLKANLDLNKAWTADRVIPLEIAAYHRHGDLWLQGWNPDDLGGTALIPTESAQAGEPVVARPLDNYDYLFGDRVSLIKIDAQGCDGAAIMGLERTIQRDHPAIVFEWEADLAKAHGYPFYQVADWLNHAGYTVHEWPSQPNNFLARWRP